MESVTCSYCIFIRLNYHRHGHRPPDTVVGAVSSTEQPTVQITHMNGENATNRVT